MIVIVMVDQVIQWMKLSLVTSGISTGAGEVVELRDPRRALMADLYMTVFQLLRMPFIGKTPFAMTSFLTNGRLHSNDGRHGYCCSPRQRSRIVGRHVTWYNLESVETRNPSHLIELASVSGSISGLNWHSCALLPTTY